MIIEHNEHPIERIVDNAFVKMHSLTGADTVIGNPLVTSDGVTIIPVSKVTMGFMTGGGEYGEIARSNYSAYPFAGGSGTGMSVTPVGFLVSDGKSVKLINIDEKRPLEKLLDVIPDVVSSFMNNADKLK